MAASLSAGLFLANSTMSLVLSSGNCFLMSCPGRTVHSSIGIMAPRPTWRRISLQISKSKQQKSTYLDTREEGELQGNIKTSEIGLDGHRSTLPGGKHQGASGRAGEFLDNVDSLPSGIIGFDAHIGDEALKPYTFAIGNVAEIPRVIASEELKAEIDKVYCLVHDSRGDIDIHK